MLQPRTGLEAVLNAVIKNPELLSVGFSKYNNGFTNYWVLPLYMLWLTRHVKQKLITT